MMKVLKFGGTSVGSTNALKSILQIVKSNIAEGVHPILVCSALFGITNKLEEAYQIALANYDYQDIINYIENRHLDIIKDLIHRENQNDIIDRIRLVIEQLNIALNNVAISDSYSEKQLAYVQSFGEQLSCQIIALYLQQNDFNSFYVDARTLIKTDSNYLHASVNFEVTNKNLRNMIVEIIAEQHIIIPVVTGFIGSTLENVTTTLGRGGSDYTASIVGSGVGAKLIEIWTDVDGIMTADPKLVHSAYTIPEMSYQEAIELSRLGAKVIYSPTMYPAYNANIPLVVRNTFNLSHHGTIINQNTSDTFSIIKAISSISHVSSITIRFAGQNFLDYTILSKVTNIFLNNKIATISTIKVSDTNSIIIVLLSCYVDNSYKLLVQELKYELDKQIIDNIIVLDGYSMLSVVGNCLADNPSTIDKFLSNLIINDIDPVLVLKGYSPISASVLIDGDFTVRALNLTHEAFFVQNLSQINSYNFTQSVKGISENTTPGLLNNS